MVNLKMERPQVSAAQLKPLLTLAIALGWLLAAWFAWNAWQLQRDGARRDAVTQSRDEAAVFSRQGQPRRLHRLIA